MSLGSFDSAQQLNHQGVGSQDSKNEIKKKSKTGT